MHRVFQALCGLAILLGLNFGVSAGEAGFSAAPWQALDHRIKRQSGPSGVSLSTAIQRRFSQGLINDSCDFSRTDLADFCDEFGQMYMDQCHMAGFTTAEIMGQGCRSGLSVPNQAGDLREYMREVNAFVGDGIWEKDARVFERDNFFDNCPALPSSVSGILQADNSFRASAVCSAAVDLECNGRKLGNSFHVVKEGDPSSFQLRTAAHVLNVSNRRLLGPREDDTSSPAGIFDFNSCVIVNAHGGVTLSAVKLGPPKFSSDKVKTTVSERLDINFSGSADLAAHDQAWFDLEATPGSNSEQILEKISLPKLPPSRRSEAEGAVVCSAGRFGPGGEVVNRCLSNPSTRGAKVDQNDVVRTRTPTVNGMSGGVYAVDLDGKTYALGVITNERDGGDTGVEIPGAGSRLIDYEPGRENHGLAY